MLESTLKGQFPGTKIEQSTDVGLELNLDEANIRCISCVTGVADYKQSKELVDESNFIQGLEKFINGMNGRAYTAVFIAEDIDYSELAEIRREYENIYTQISPFANVQFSYANSFGNNISKTKSRGESNSNTDSSNESVTVNEATSTTDTKSVSAAKGKTNTTVISETKGHSTTDSSSESNAKSTSVAEGHTESQSISKTKGSSASAGVRIGSIINLSCSKNRSKTKTKHNNLIF